MRRRSGTVVKARASITSARSTAEEVRQRAHFFRRYMFLPPGWPRRAFVFCPTVALAAFATPQVRWHELASIRQAASRRADRQESSAMRGELWSGSQGLVDAVPVLGNTWASLGMAKRCVS